MFWQKQKQKLLKFLSDKRHTIKYKLWFFQSINKI